MAHTPGPWHVFYKRKYDEWHVSLPCEDSNMCVALCPDGVPGSTEEECGANAHLIAAAPELLDALKALLEDTQHSTHDCGDQEWCPVIKARAVIAKAKGKQS